MAEAESEACRGARASDEISTDCFLPGKEANLTFLEFLRIPRTSRGDGDGIDNGLERIEGDGRGIGGSGIEGTGEGGGP